MPLHDLRLKNLHYWYTEQKNDLTTRPKVSFTASRRMLRHYLFEDSIVCLKMPTIRREYGRCGKRSCEISHGPCYYAYWKERVVITDGVLADNDNKTNSVWVVTGIGKRFTVLIIWNMMNNQSRFNQFIESIEGINPKLLSTWLNMRQ